MKIGIYHNLPSGGAKRALSELARRLASRHELHLISLSSANQTFADIRSFCTTHKVIEFQPTPLLRSPLGRINQLLRLFDLGRLRRLTRRIARDFEQAQVDVVFVNPCQYENSPSILRYMQGIPTVFFCQEPLRLAYEEMPSRPYAGEVNTGWRKLLERIDPLPGLYFGNLQKSDRENLHHANRILVNSHFMQETVSKIYGVDPVVSYLGVDVNVFKPSGASRSDYVLSVGSLTPLKGFDFLIRSLAQLPEANRPPLKILCNFQNPPERAFLLNLAAELQVDVQIHVDVSDEELVEHYNRAVMTLYAPIREPFGFVPIESMACGVPVVAVHEGGIRETVIDGEVGLTTPRDEIQFAGAVRQLLESPDRLEEMSARARKQALDYWTWDRAVERVEQNLIATASPYH